MVVVIAVVVVVVVVVVVGGGKDEDDDEENTVEWMPEVPLVIIVEECGCGTKKLHTSLKN